MRSLHTLPAKAGQYWDSGQAARRRASEPTFTAQHGAKANACPIRLKPHRPGLTELATPPYPKPRDHWSFAGEMRQRVLGERRLVLPCARPFHPMPQIEPPAQRILRLERRRAETGVARA